mgnify:CR=1 FL=1
MISSNYFVETLNHIASLPTRYEIRSPKNLGYYDGDYYYYDWNLFKVVINRIELNGEWYDSEIGEYQKDLSITKDLSPISLLDACKTKSNNFSELSQIGAYVLIRNSISGVYIGNIVINGKHFNCIEASNNGIQYGWIDADGTRRKYQGGAKNGQWTDWGLLPWINY